jgi:hypothetical protein
MDVLNPIGLWALAGLLVPIGIHLLSRKEGRVIDIGSVRHLNESPTTRFKRIRVNEIALLLLRSQLVILSVMFLAGASINPFRGQSQKWLILEDGVDRSDEVKQTIEKLGNRGYEVRLLAREFPRLSEQSANTRPFNNYWTAARELARQKVDSIVVISYNYQRKFKGQRIALPENIRWISHPVKEKKEFVSGIISSDSGSLWVRKGKTSALSTAFETQKNLPLSQQTDLPPVKQPDVIDVTLFTGEGFSHDERILIASLKAVQSITPHKIKINKRKASESREPAQGVVFWLAAEPPASNAGVVTMAYRKCRGENIPLLITSDEALHFCFNPGDEKWVITKRLNQEIALQDNLALHLSRLVLPSLKENDQHDHRVLPEQITWSESSDHASVIDKQTNGSSFILLLLLTTLAVERWLAYKRNQ